MRSGGGQSLLEAGSRRGTRLAEDERLLGKLWAPAVEFNMAKRLGIAALTLSLLMWLVAFLTVGAEWFLMWQSKAWNGQEAAGRMFNVIGLLLIYVALPDTEEQA